MYSMPLADPGSMSNRQALPDCPNRQIATGHPALIPTLIQLLEGALGANRVEARSSIRRALSILEAERSRRETSLATPVAASRGGLSPWHARRIKRHIEDTLGGALLIEDLAAIAQLSNRHFSLTFKQTFGQSPHVYIVRRRIEAAQRMMLLTDDPLAQIALDCGLADQAYLSKWFRRLIGVSPAAWRKAHRA